MNEQLEKIKSDLDTIRNNKYVTLYYGEFYEREQDIKCYNEDDRYCGKRIRVDKSNCKVHIFLLPKDSFDIIVDVLMKSYQFIDEVEKLYIYKLSSPDLNEALNYYLNCFY